MKETQKEKVKNYILENGNKPLKYDVIASALNIRVPNVRRILGQGVFSNDFERVSRGFYIVKKDVKTDVKNDVENDWADLLEEIIKNDDNNNIGLYKMKGAK
tara:strand:- start:570 stop:875 length:306 start_codon:yes stop_codon:yes gene_type:complete